MFQRHQRLNVYRQLFCPNAIIGKRNKTSKKSTKSSTKAIAFINPLQEKAKQSPNTPEANRPANEKGAETAKGVSTAKTRRVERPVIHAFKSGTAPPKFVIDLDKPPEKRWSEAVDWGAHLLQLAVPRHTDPMDGYFWDNALMRGIEKRYTFSNEQMAELEGIAEQTKIPLKKLISYNLALNNQFACTSGTAPLVNSDRLLHFRVLDPVFSLAHLFIEACFIRHNQYVASAILHLGHVAFATGVRPGLSISVNTNHGYINWTKAILPIIDWALYDPWPIVTRDLLLRESVPSLEDAIKELTRGKPNTVYVALSDGSESYAIEQQSPGESVVRGDNQGVLALGNHYATISDNFAFVSAKTREHAQADISRLKYLTEAIQRSNIRNQNQGVTVEDIRTWISTRPIKHADTALSCIMDPVEGKILWSAAYEDN